MAWGKANPSRPKSTEKQRRKKKGDQRKIYGDGGGRNQEKFVGDVPFTRCRKFRRSSSSNCYAAMSRESRGGEAVPAEEKKQGSGGDSAGRLETCKVCSGGEALCGEEEEGRELGANG